MNDRFPGELLSLATVVIAPPLTPACCNPSESISELALGIAEPVIRSAARPAMRSFLIHSPKEVKTFLDKFA
jgi:hypothetical protein